MWYVSVYCEAHRTEVYHFSQKSLVKESILTTWGKQMSDIIITENECAIIVRHSSTGEIALRAHPVCVLRGPTHF